MQWPWQIPVPSVLLHRGLVILSQSVLVAGQNLLGRCYSPVNQSSVNMVTTDDENSLSFQCLGSIFWVQTKCWIITPSSGSHLPAMFPRIEHANMQLPVSFPQQSLCEHWHFRIVYAFLWGWFWLWQSTGHTFWPHKLIISSSPRELNVLPTCMPPD